MRVAIRRSRTGYEYLHFIPDGPDGRPEVEIEEDWDGNRFVQYTARLTETGMAAAAALVGSGTVLGSIPAIFGCRPAVTGPASGERCRFGPEQQRAWNPEHGAVYALDYQQWCALRGY